MSWLVLNQLREAFVVVLIKHLRIIRRVWVAYRPSQWEQLAGLVQERACFSPVAKDRQVEYISVAGGQTLQNFSVFVGLLDVLRVTLLVVICSTEVDCDHRADA